MSPTLPFANLLGIQIIESSAEKVVAELLVRDDLCTQPAVLHGGAAMALADTLGALATLQNLPPGAGTTTIESKTNFLAPAPAGTTTAPNVRPSIAENEPRSGNLASRHARGDRSR